MFTPVPPQSRLPDAASRTVAVTLAEVAGLSRELALMAGRTPLQVSQADYEQAKRELLGRPPAKIRKAPPRAPTRSVAGNAAPEDADTR